MNSLNRDMWEETEACVQANFDDLENGKIKFWEARNNILAHFKTKQSHLLSDARREERMRCLEVVEKSRSTEITLIKNNPISKEVDESCTSSVNRFADQAISTLTTAEESIKNLK